jgi:hypothetical protein
LEENLLGHLLKANDADTARVTETRLADDPSAIHDLTVLRRALLPLAADRDDVDAPSDLWVRTLTRVAEHLVATEGPTARREDARTEDLIRQAALFADSHPASISVSPAPMSEAVPLRARRRNVIAVVGLSASVLALVFPVVVHVRQHNQRMACQNGMQQFYQAAVRYSDDNRGQFPQVPEGQVAASAAVTLQRLGYLPEGARIACPAGGPENTEPATMANYAYSLGFRDQSGRLWGLERRPECDVLPILADAPIRHGRQALPGNHPYGHNVLFAGGNVRFCTSANVGVNGDDIFCNANGKVGAGLFPTDSALGRPLELP